MPWIGLGIVEWSPRCYGLLPSLYPGYGMFFSFVISEARLALYLGCIVDHHALRYLHFKSTRRFSVREIFE